MALCSDGEELLSTSRVVSSAPISTGVFNKTTGGMVVSVLWLNQTTRGELGTRATRKPVRKPACIRYLPYQYRQYARLLAIWAPGLVGLARPHPAEWTIA
jgi:hypothetical protein